MEQILGINFQSTEIEPTRSVCQKYITLYQRQIKDQQKYEITIKNLLPEPNYQKINRKKDEKQSFVQKYSWLCKQKQYFDISDEDIKEQNRHLKTALIEINDKVDKTIKDISPKIDKRINEIVFKQKWKQRTRTEAQFLTNHNNTLEHRKKIQSMEESNNEFVIKIYKKQYRKLKNREKYILDEDEELSESMHQNDKQKNIKIRNKSSLFSANSRVRERLHSHIQQTVDVISKTKVVNRKIKERNRTLGNSIHNTDEFILSMKKLFESVDLQQRKKKKLEKNLAQTQMNITQIYRKLSKIQSQWSTAEEYLQNINKKQQNAQQNKQREDTLKKKQVCKDFTQKKKEFQLQNNQINYHNMLKNLDKVRQSIKDTNDKLSQIELENAHLNNEINYLQATLVKIKKIKKQQLNKKRTGTMILSNQLFSQSDMNSQKSSIQKSSMHLNQQMGELLIQERKRPNAQVQTQNNEKAQIEVYEYESLLEQEKNRVTKKSIQNVKNQSEKLQ